MNSPPPEDAPFDRLVAGAQQGDPRAFEGLVHRVERPLTGFLRARGAPDVEGLANEVLISVFRAIDGFTGNEVQFRAWVFTIARNRLIDERRRQTRRPDTTATEPGELPDVAHSQDVDAVDEAERAERLLASLTDEQREVVVLRVIAGLSVDETAQVVGKRAGAVRALQHRALTHLRRELSRNP